MGYEYIGPLINGWSVSYSIIPNICVKERISPATKTDRERRTNVMTSQQEKIKNLQN